MPQRLKPELYSASALCAFQYVRDYYVRRLPNCCRFLVCGAQPDCKLQYAMAHSAEKNDRNGKLLHSTMAVKFYFTVAEKVFEGEEV
jgi:hypothetical protein